ncbi:MAG: hypothetical protein PHV34_17440 [Verrucomicrobiae bacterium]|nr:hypothetical protein [Verrucomicrobiae bacterium]
MAQLNYAGPRARQLLDETCSIRLRSASYGETSARRKNNHSKAGYNRPEPFRLRLSSDYGGTGWEVAKPSSPNTPSASINQTASFIEGGKALHVVMPGLGPRFTMPDNFADAVRKVSAETGLPHCDIQKMFKKIGANKLEPLFNDMAHPNKEGCRMMAGELATFLIEAGKREN